MAHRNIPGVKRLPDGRYFVRVTARDPRTRVKVHRKRTIDPMPLEDVLIVRATMMKELKKELATGRRKNDSNYTIADFAEQWMARKAQRLKRSVTEHYMATLAERVLPVLGELRVADVTRTDVEEWVIWAEQQRTKSNKPYARATLHSWWRVMGTMLRDAAAEAGIADPTVRVEPPRSQVRNVREKKTLTTEQLGVLLQTVKKHFTAWYPEVLVLAFTGMRAGELYALHWEDVDEEAGCLQIHRGVWHGTITSTKTDAPRDVALPVIVQETLREHRASLSERQLASGLVFPSIKGTPRYSNTLAKTLGLCSQVMDISVKIGPQVLRRTFNTLLLEAGVNQVVLRSQMGHSSAQMTERYAGVHIERKQAAVGQLVDLVTSKEG